MNELAPDLPADRPTLVRRLARRRGVRQFIKFGIVGASGFIVNLVIFTVLQNATPKALQAAHYTSNYSLSFLGGGVSNYFLNRAWTFRSSAHPVRQGLQFMAVSLGALVVGLIVSHVVQPYLGPGHKTWFLGTLSGIVVNFFVNKYWTFREPA